ncbi:MAG: Bug family tripartite tricarboxylate transporter substrate binding protein [Beijerinckiaceae bacterium]
MRNAAKAFLFAVLPALVASAQAQDADNFYAGRTIGLLVSAGSGGGYDTYGRLMARHIVKYIPGAPSVAVQNFTGAGGLRAAIHMYNVAPRDGSTIALIQSTALLAPVMGEETRFDPAKFSWIGNLAEEFSVCASWHTSNVKTAKDLLTKEFIVGGSGAGTSMESYPKVLNNIFGTKIRIISGYKGGADVLIAMERGEVDGRCGASLSTYRTIRPEWLEQGKINVVLQTSLKKDPAAGDAPWIMDLPMTEQQRATLELIMAPRLMHRTFLAPPETMPARLATLRSAFAKAVQDPEFMAEAKQQSLDIDYSSPEEIDQLVRKLAALPREIRHSAADALKREDRTSVMKK